jgi:hypothetical protein
VIISSLFPGSLPTDHFVFLSLSFETHGMPNRPVYDYLGTLGSVSFVVVDQLESDDTFDDAAKTLFDMFQRHVVPMFEQKLFCICRSADRKQYGVVACGPETKWVFQLNKEQNNIQILSSLWTSCRELAERYHPYVLRLNADGSYTLESSSKKARLHPWVEQLPESYSISILTYP